MIDLSTYKRSLYHMGETEGMARKEQSDKIMNWTWKRDLQSRVCYLYDYYHDDEPDKNYNLHPNQSRCKTPIDVKYIVNSYNSDGKDQVSYHIQFRPNQECNVDYYEDNFVKRCGATFPIGLYIDIPDDKKIYRRWLIIENANTYDPQFITWSILPCDYRFCWIYKNQKYKMWGVSRSQSS